MENAVSENNNKDSNKKETPRKKTLLVVGAVALAILLIVAISMISSKLSNNLEGLQKAISNVQGIKSAELTSGENTVLGTEKVLTLYLEDSEEYNSEVHSAYIGMFPNENSAKNYAEVVDGICDYEKIFEDNDFSLDNMYDLGIYTGDIPQYETYVYGPYVAMFDPFYPETIKNQVINEVKKKGESYSKNYKDKESDGEDNIETYCKAVYDNVNGQIKQVDSKIDERIDDASKEIEALTIDSSNYKEMYDELQIIIDDNTSILNTDRYKEKAQKLSDAIENALQKCESFATEERNRVQALADKVNASHSETDLQAFEQGIEELRDVTLFEEDVEKWDSEYSNIRQTIIDEKEAAEKAKQAEYDNAPLEYRQAVGTAKSYLKYMGFSQSGLIDQLEYEGYSYEAASWAVNYVEIDWNEQAAKVAQSYINSMSFSRQGLLEQLLYEGFSQEQAEYGVAAVGY